MRFLSPNGVNTQIPSPRDYYISNDGVGTGLTSDDPAPPSVLETVSLNNEFVSGDSVYLNRGENYYIGDIRLINGMTVNSFGSGDRPKIYGSVPISGSWTSLGSNMYSKVFTEDIKWVYKDEVAAKLGSSAWMLSTATPSATVITGNPAVLNTFSNLVGAKIRIFVQIWIVSPELTITAYDSGTGQITVNSSYEIYGSVGNSVYFIIYNQLQFVTGNNDWYFDTATKTLYYKSTVDPSTLDLRVGYKTNCLSVNGSDIEISSLEIKHFTNGVYADSGTSFSVACDDLVVTDCKSRGVYLPNSNGTSVLNSEFHRCTNSAFVITGTDVIGENNICDTIGMDFEYPTGFAAAYIVSGDNAINRKNRANNLAYCGTLTSGANFLVEKNVWSNLLQRIPDGGAFYTSGNANTPLVSTNYNGIIRNNIARDFAVSSEGGLQTQIVMGIYIDNRSEGMTVEDNTVVGSSYGIMANWNSKNTTIKRNNVVGSIDFGIIFRQDTNPLSSPLFPNNVGNIVEDNIIASRIGSSECVAAKSDNSSDAYNPFTTGGNSDNNHYVNPYSTNIANYNGATNTNYNLAGWRTKMGDDAASTARVNYIAYSNATNALQEVKIEINETDNAVQFNVPAGYSDYNGNAFNNPVTIQPFSSLVYFKNTAYP